MITGLHVKNLALIDEAEVSFQKGLNILSGETGAGKSVLIGSINLALGQKGSKDMIRTGKEEALVELTFSVDHPAVREKLKKMEIALEDEEEIVITRKLTEKKSVSRINGETVPVKKLSEITSLLLDIHGQHEHQSLLSEERQLLILDDFAGTKQLRHEVEQLYRAYQAEKRQLSRMDQDEQERERKKSFLSYEIGEIEEAHIKPGEEEQLLSDLKRLTHAKTILSGMEEIRNLLGFDGGRRGDAGAGGKVSEAIKKLSQILIFDEGLKDIDSMLLDLESLLNDVNQAVDEYAGDIEVDEEALQETSDRLQLLHELERKYGQTVEDILAYQEKAEKELDELTHFEERLEGLQRSVKEKEKALKKAATALTEKRKEAGERLSEAITKALSELNFSGARFFVSLSPLLETGEKGADQISFLLSANTGTPLRPLKDVASGGELSRIMLAIKTVLAETDDIETLIFDEVDAGISGRTAQMVSEKLRQIGKYRQVICISHLPQIVAMADTHFLIEKNSTDTETISRIKALSYEESVTELARLLGGREITGQVMASAREMKALAAQDRG